MLQSNGKYNKVSIGKELRASVSDEDVKTIEEAIVGYGNLQLVATTASTTPESIRGIIQAKKATPTMLTKVLGAIDFIKQKQTVEA